MKGNFVILSFPAFLSLMLVLLEIQRIMINIISQIISAPTALQRWHKALTQHKSNLCCLLIKGTRGSNRTYTV